MLASLLLALSRGEFKTVVLDTPEGAREPQIAVSSEGGVYVAYGTRDFVYVSVSTDDGATFEPTRKIGGAGTFALGMRRGPRIAVAGQAIVVTAVAGAKGGGQDGDVVTWHSTDRGGSWTYDGRVNEVAGAAREGLQSLAAGPNGNLFCAWIDLAKDAPRICGASSSGESPGRWSETRVAFADPDGICPCCHPSVAFDANGKLYVMWRGHDGESRDMVVATSNDLGATFSKPAKLGTGTWKLEACPMDGGALAFGLDKVRSVWRRESSIFRAEPAGPKSKIGDGEQPTIAVGENGEYVAWLERRGGPLLLLPPLVKEPIRLDEHANDPVLAAGPRTGIPVFAVWESGPSDAPKIVVARLDGVPAPSGK